jgi:hypothetical protein
MTEVVGFTALLLILIKVSAVVNENTFNLYRKIYRTPENLPELDFNLFLLNRDWNFCN